MYANSKKWTLKLKVPFKLRMFSFLPTNWNKSYFSILCRKSYTGLHKRVRVHYAFQKAISLTFFDLGCILNGYNFSIYKIMFFRLILEKNWIKNFRERGVEIFEKGKKKYYRGKVLKKKMSINFLKLLEICTRKEQCKLRNMYKAECCWNFIKIVKLLFVGFILYTYVIQEMLNFDLQSLCSDRFL